MQNAVMALVENWMIRWSLDLMFMFKVVTSTFRQLAEIFAKRIHTSRFAVFAHPGRWGHLILNAADFHFDGSAYSNSKVCQNEAFLFVQQKRP